MKIHELNFEGHYKARWQRVKESFPQTEDPMSMIKEKTNMFIKGLIEKCMDAEFREQIKSSSYERTDSRNDYRNGFRYRDLQTNFGTIKRIKIPRGRKSGYEYKLFKRYQRRHDEFDTAVLWATLGGMSQRRTKEMFKGIMGNNLSETTVSRILKSLDKQLKEYREFPVILKYKYLLLDGFWIHILDGNVLTKRCVVCAMGITDTGEHDLLGFKLMTGESEESIKMFLNDLHCRGLTDIDLIIHDGSKGIENASKWIYPYAEHQRCVFHKQMNLLHNISKQKNKKIMLKDSKKIFKAKTKLQALKLSNQFKERWIKEESKAVKKFFKDFDQCLTYFNFPKKQHSWIKTSNHIELYFKQIRRRIRPIGCFKNKSSAERYIFGLIKIIGHNLTNISL